MQTGDRQGWGVAALLLAAGSALGQVPYPGPAGEATGPVISTYQPAGAAATYWAVPPGSQAVGVPASAAQAVPEPISVAPGPQMPSPGLGPVQAQPPGPAASGAAAGKSFWQRCQRRWQECFCGLPEEFQQPPLGHSVYANFKTHVENGEAARMALYRYDFIEGGSALNPRGRERLAQIAELLPRNFFPVVIEPAEGPPVLNEARRLAVLDDLGHGPFPVPPQRVVVGNPSAIGLSGREAMVIYQNLIYQTQQRGYGGQAGSTFPAGVGPLGIGTAGAGAPVGAAGPGPAGAPPGP
ncbi:MAG: hypothetical protein U0797_04560 [Gemmataceae bacterium]